MTAPHHQEEEEFVTLIDVRLVSGLVAVAFLVGGIFGSSLMALLIWLVG